MDLVILHSIGIIPMDFIVFAVVAAIVASFVYFKARKSTIAETSYVKWVWAAALRLRNGSSS